MNNKYFIEFIKSLYPSGLPKIPELQRKIFTVAFNKMLEEGIDWSTPIKMNEKERVAFRSDLGKRIKEIRKEFLNREILTDRIDQFENINSPKKYNDGEDYKAIEELHSHYDKLLSKLPPLEAEAVQLLTEKDIKPLLTLGFDERGQQMIMRRAYIHLLWNKEIIDDRMLK